MLSRSVGKYQSTLRNIPEDRRSHLHRGESVESRILTPGFFVIAFLIVLLSHLGGNLAFDCWHQQ
jgi:hypothetical protein